MRSLKTTLDRIDRKGYGAYKDLSGSFEFDGFTLSVDRVQRDPFAPPSLIRARTHTNRFDSSLLAHPVRRVALDALSLRESLRPPPPPPPPPAGPPCGGSPSRPFSRGSLTGPSVRSCGATAARAGAGG